MKVNSANKSETQEIKLSSNPKDDECLCPCDMNFKEMVNNQAGGFSSDNLISSLSADNSLLVKSSDLKAAFTYDTFSMDKDDAKFFIDMVNNSQFAFNMQGDVNSSILQLSGEKEIKTFKSANVSKTLINLIQESQTTQKPVRIDFDNNVSVILKVNKDGKINAEFIPGDKAVEQYLRDNIGFLKQRFEEQNLPYSDLSYRQHKQQNNKNKNNNNENKGE